MATSASAANVLATAPDIIPAHIADRRNSHQKTAAMRCNCGADSSRTPTADLAALARHADVEAKSFPGQVPADHLAHASALPRLFIYCEEVGKR